MGRLRTELAPCGPKSSERAGAPRSGMAGSQVVDASERARQLRALVSSADASKNWDLRCKVREAMIESLQRQDPDGLPRVRAELARADREPRGQKPPMASPQAGVGDSSAIRVAWHAGEHAPERPAESQVLARHDGTA